MTGPSSKPISLVPMMDLTVQHSVLVDEILGVTREILSAGVFVGGKHVEAFEKEWADYCQTRLAVGVGSGTDALRFALLAAGVGKGDEVLTVPFTFAATLEAILQVGARPVLVDVDPVTYTLDPALLKRSITKRSKAIVPVHLYGHPADMDAIHDLASGYGIRVIEDAAQAHGAIYKGRKAGSLGAVAAFSFYPAKNLGACGESGAITTDDPALAQKVRMLRDHGQSEKYLHEIEGYNGRLDAIQAAILRIKLRRLPQWNEARRHLASVYDESLSDIPELILPKEAAFARAVYHLYVVRTRRRAELREKLKERGIGTGLHYPHPLHLQKAFSALGYSSGSFPVSELLAGEVLSLPLYPELDPDSVRYVSAQIRSILKN